MVEHIAERLAAIPGVVAVTLGGSRATGTAVEGSDWDFGLYYRGGHFAAWEQPDLFAAEMRDAFRTLR